MSENTRVKFSITMPEHLYDHFVKRAAERKTTVEKEVIDQLSRCKSHTAARPIYFDDDERGVLEHITGGWAIESAEMALTRIKQLVKVTVGKVEVDLDDRVLQRAAHRAKAERKELPEWITREVTQGLERSVGLRPA